ncbi:hypothetical protein BT93_L4199 [Corymbia citriodora subsp. variegata]|uniref:Uncharacterized protein n=1 Tax=Corymbia citriodora subsp. variegata TaxID=360336 RepID=A0A8T0CH80_CORYI|nr:hypothetical protein BT93_L4199 [Corymbia citriodora subsp. variegata]
MGRWHRLPSLSTSLSFSLYRVEFSRLVRPTLTISLSRSSPSSSSRGKRSRTSPCASTSILLNFISPPSLIAGVSIRIIKETPFLIPLANFGLISSI